MKVLPNTYPNRHISTLLLGLGSLSQLHSCRASFEVFDLCFFSFVLSACISSFSFYFVLIFSIFHSSLFSSFCFTNFYHLPFVSFSFIVSWFYGVTVSGGLSPAAAVSSLDSALSSGDETVILGALNAVSSLSLVTRKEEAQRQNQLRKQRKQRQEIQGKLHFR